MIRPTTPDETPTLVALADGTNVFKPHEMVALREVLDDYHAAHQRMGHQCVTAEIAGQIHGFVYFAPAAMTDRTWYLYWIAVRQDLQAKGVGTRLLHHAEEVVRQNEGRLLLIDTSSLPQYELTRRFYLKHKYEQGAVIRDFYADGDDLVVYRKRLSD